MHYVVTLGADPAPEGNEAVAVGNMAEDLTGRRFGNLTAVRRAENRNGRTCWVCRCACGAEKTVTAHDLKSGRVKSCGCLKSENQKRISGQLHRIDGTCVELLRERKPRKDNKGGFRGVYLMKDQRYRVDIGFKKKRFYVGMFDTFEEAVQARLDAEKMIYDGFLKAYKVWREKADTDPSWAESHPLKFGVEKTDGRLKVLIE